MLVSRWGHALFCGELAWLLGTTPLPKSGTLITNFNSILVPRWDIFDPGATRHHDTLAVLSLAFRHAGQRERHNQKLPRRTILQPKIKVYKYSFDYGGLQSIASGRKAESILGNIVRAIGQRYRTSLTNWWLGLRG